MLVKDTVPSAAVSWTPRRWFSFSTPAEYIE